MADYAKKTARLIQLNAAHSTPRSAHSARPAPASAVLRDQRPQAVALIQRKKAPDNSAQGLPAKLKHGIQQLSGISMDAVKVHYNSTQPAQLQAHAYTQGETIHLAPGQQRHLAHEAWHVVQQKQGRVSADSQSHAGVALNTDPRLEQEADQMGAQALQRASQPGAEYVTPSATSSQPAPGTALQLQKATGWYRLSKEANFRNDDAEYSVIKKLAAQTVVEVQDKGGRTSKFKAGLKSNEHSWIENPIGHEHGWIEDSKLAKAAAYDQHPRDLVHSHLLGQAAQNYPSSVTQYVSKTDQHLGFNVIKTGNRFEIHGNRQGMAGYLEYKQVGQEIDIRHFEAQPEGMGLGSALMYEFAIFASSLGLRKVAVQTPAFSAMGAYKAFGGKPQASDLVEYQRKQARYQHVMGLRHDDEQGEHIIAEHEDDTYDHFIEGEASAMGKSRANRAAFDNPELSEDALSVIRETKEAEYRAAHPRTVENVKRVAELRALSPHLSYDIAELKTRSAAMLKNKWHLQ